MDTILDEIQKALEETRQVAYWWVSQSRTYREQRGGGYIWAPIRDRGNRQPHHWQTLARVKADDVIFSYVDGAIRSFGVAKRDTYNAPRPEQYEQSVEGNNKGSPR